jgi:hypothetical protein
MKEITMTAEAPETAPQELDHRVSDGIHGRCSGTLRRTTCPSWCTTRPSRDVRDRSSGGRALDVFHHPFAYAAFEGTEFATRVREPVGV